MKESLLKIKTYLLNGVSFAIPFIACGGILIATAIAFAPMTSTGPDFSHAPTLKLILDIGSASFALMLPVLAGYIAYAMASRPGLVPGFIGGYLAGQVNAGFFGALIAGLLAGYIVNLIKKVEVPAAIRPIMPILIIPIISSLIVGGLMLKVIGLPIADLMKLLGVWLQTMGHGNAILLAVILGSMIAFDMGGPVNKAAFFFGAAMIKEGNFAVMGAVAAAICTPPLGMGLATLLKKSLWTEEQRESGKASLAMGLIGITEGAIPFAAADPIRVIPCIMGGSAVASAIAMLGGVGDHAPHGGPIVLPVVDHRLMYVVAILAGTLVTALAINLLKSHQTKEPAA
jgi:fructose-specific phosphotransferase system IIC component